MKNSDIDFYALWLARRWRLAQYRHYYAQALHRRQQAAFRHDIAIRISDTDSDLYKPNDDPFLRGPEIRRTHSSPFPDYRPLPRRYIGGGARGSSTIPMSNGKLSTFLGVRDQRFSPQPLLLGKALKRQHRAMFEVY